MLKDFVSDLKPLFPANAHAELRAQLNRSRGVALVGGNLVDNARADASGVSARVYQNGVYGFASMAELSRDAAKAVLLSAVDNARFMDEHICKNKPPLAPLTTGFHPLNRNVNDVEQKAYIDFARAIDAYITEKYANLASRSVIVREDSMEKLLIVTDGMSAHTVNPRAYCYIKLNALANDGAPVERTAVDCVLGTFDEVYGDPSRLYERIDKVYEELMKKREAVFADAGLATVVLGGELCGMLAHEAVGHTVEADLVIGGSVAGPMLNKRVASELVSLTDFASVALGAPAPLPVYVDDEGTPAEDVEIIKDGILLNFMNSRETAPKFGMQPKGNARAFAFSDEPLIRMRNTAVLPGKSKLDDILASVDNGYYLVDTNNGQADTTGEFMFGVSMGYEIKNGKLARAIRDTTITGIAFEMLKTVDMVSDHMNWASSGFCGKKQPMPVGMGGPEIRCKVMMGGR